MASKIPQKRPPQMGKAHPFFGKKLNAPSMNPEEVKQRFMQFWDAGQFEAARQVALDFLKVAPNVAQAWSDAAACSVHLQDWQKAIECGKRSVALDDSILAGIDALSHAYANVNDLVNAKKVGHLALEKRNARFGQSYFQPWVVQAALPLSMNRERNIIAFSLFGSSSKYCESALLNVSEQPRLYPNWTCLFYIDDSVPTEIAQRLRAGGAQVIQVDESLKKWPGPMWRFAAYDDPTVERVIFRDADSVISQREVDAVQEWVDSGKAFHMMRDSGSHTELILAGLWGCTRASLPPMRAMVADFLKVEPESKHFADQFFLREYVWPYMRGNVMQHDSLFDFMSPRPFPEGAHRLDFHTGCAETSPVIETAVDAPDGTVVHWTIWDTSSNPEALVCRYSAVVQGGKITANAPRRYVARLNQDYVVRVER